MYPLTTHFEQLLLNIRPPEERIQAAQDLPPLVRDYLEQHEDFETIAPHSRLVGSYAQGLCVGDVKDVDFLVRVPGDPKKNEPEAKRLIQDLRKALEDLPEALGFVGSANIDIERARRSVHVYFEDHDFHLDVVPCIAPDGFEEPLFVPDRGFNEWIASHPIGYINLINELNNDHGKKVKPLCRILKHFRDYQMKTRKPKSYWLGALVIQELEKGELDTTQSLGVIFHALVDSIYRRYAHLLKPSETATPNLADPLLGHNISWNWSRTHFETFMRRVDEARSWAEKALEEDDREAAIEYWQKIFGREFFPSDVEEAVLRAAQIALPGTSFVDASGLVTKNPPDSDRYVETRKTTFHGPIKRQ